MHLDNSYHQLMVSFPKTPVKTFHSHLPVKDLFVTHQEKKKLNSIVFNLCGDDYVVINVSEEKKSHS